MSLDTFVNENVIAAIAGIAVFVTLLVFGQMLVPSDPMAARVRSHKQRRDTLRGELIAGASRGQERRAASIKTLKQLLERLKLLRGDEARKMSEQLAQAGWRSRDALAIYLGVRLAMPFVAGIIAFVVLMVVAPSAQPMQKLLGLVISVLVGFFAPVLGLRRAIKRRQYHLRRQLPDGLDLLVICCEAGLSLDAALNRMAREIGFSSPHLADEIGLTAVELGFLPNRRQALQNLAKRTDLAAIRGVVNTLVQTERYGTPLAHSLRVLSAEFRDERMLKAEEKAARLPATLTVPMILFILPTLFVVLIGPAIINVFAHFK
jgi:tight adherence protein C